MLSQRTPLAVIAATLILGPAPAGAQNLSELLPRLLSEAVTMPSTVGNVAGNPHEAHFLPAAAQLRAPYALNGALVSQLSTFPLGSSSGGFTYTLDEKTGIPQRSSGNFGPAFAERALTNGKGKLSLGLNYQHVSFDRFENVPLGGGAAFYLQHNDCCPLQASDGTPRPGAPVQPSQDVNPFFEGDLVRAQLSLEATTDTAVMFGNYGVSDRFDVAVALPFVRVDLDATMTSSIIRLSTATNPAIHNFGGSSPDTRTAHESGSASGVGDLLIRGKYRFLSRTGGGLAAGLDVRLPTGNKDDLLGTGATQVKTSLIYSGDYGWFSPHLNVGYTWSDGSLSDSLGQYSLGDQVPAPIPQAPDAYDAVFGGQSVGSPVSSHDLEVPDEIDYTAGFAIRASPRITLNADFVGRTLLDVNRFGTTSRSYNFRLATDPTLQSRSFGDVFDITQSSGNLTLLLGTAGIKINIAKTLLLNANVLFPLSSDGLRPKVTPVVGLDYAF